MNPVLLRRSIGSLVCVLLVWGAVGSPLSAQELQTAPPQLGIDTVGFDPSVRPQDDFYAYVNGNWLRETVIPEDRTSVGTFAMLADQSEASLREIVEAATAGTLGDDPDARRIGDLYLSFMDTLRVEALGLNPVRSELARIATMETHSDLAEEFGRLASLGLSPIFGFYVGADPVNSRMNAISLSQGGLGLGDRDLYFEEGERFDEIRRAYRNYVVQILTIAGIADSRGAADRILAVEHALAEAQWTRVRNRDRNATYNPIGGAELPGYAPHFDWEAFYSAAELPTPERLIVRQPDFIRSMDRIIAGTPISTWREYLQFRLLDEAAPYLSSDLVSARFAFRGSVVQGMQANRERWRRGLTFVEQALGEPLGRFYVDRHFQPEARLRMEDLVENLLAAFRESIDELEWMSEETRQEAQRKLAQMTVKIGHPEVWQDYSALDIRADDLYGNWERSRRFAYQKMTAQIGEPVNRDEWFMTPQTVNAYYSPANNEIAFPAAILQPPFFDAAADDAVNYGAIGAVIGHEISHGFDDQGRKSDGEGNLRDWWTDGDAAAFEERANRLAEQYSRFSPLEGMTLNGKLSLGENIGDLSGLTVAYRAYRRSLDGQEAPDIAGFSGDQRFFFGWAQIWRTLYREEALRQLVLTGPHSPGEYRVNGIVRNLPAFIAAFEVGEADGMYLKPEEQVQIW